MTQNPLFARLFDYAGVFPPASLDVAAATGEYRRALASPDGWLLGPMLLRSSQVKEYSPPEDGTVPLGLIVDEAVAADVADVIQAERRTDSTDPRSAIEVALRHAPVAYLESTDPDDLRFLDAVAEARGAGHDVRAKIRTGGPTAQSFPSSHTVAGFITRCVDRGIPFKATAGLHHPVRHPSAVDDAVEHGFINVLSAVRCVLGDRPESAVACLDEVDPEAFDMATATWKGVGNEVPPAALRETFRSIGSCSFSEPAGYLRDLGVI